MYCRGQKVVAGKKQWAERRIATPETKLVATAKSDEENLVDPKLDNHEAVTTILPPPAPEQ